LANHGRLNYAPAPSRRKRQPGPARKIVRITAQRGSFPALYY
jgi:hypothetical protein